MSATISLASNSASGRDRAERDRPVAPAGRRHADDVEFDIAAARVPRQRVFDPPRDLLDGGRGLCEKRLEVHVAPPVPAVPGDGGGRSGRIIVGADLVNGALRAGFFRGCARRRWRQRTRQWRQARPRFAPACWRLPSSRWSTLLIATFELSMADFPSGVVIMGIVPLAALLFFACLVWSASQLLRIRKDGVKFALPFAICAATLLALQYAPLQTIYLKHNFWTPSRRPRADRRAGREWRAVSQCRPQQEPDQIGSGRAQRVRRRQRHRDRRHR